MRFSEFGYSLSEAPLAPGLFKYQGTSKDRIPIFLQKIKDESPFQIQLKNKVVDVIIDPKEYKKVSQWVKNPVPGLRLNTTGGLNIPLGSIIKTKEFGGESAGQREKIEQDQISKIGQELEKLKNGRAFVPLRVGDKIVHAAHVEKEKGSVNGKAPKSDMTVLDENGDPVAWVSLKGHSFRWGGWNHLMNVPEIANWLNAVRAETGNILEPGQSYGLKIGNNLKAKIIYGKEFGKSRGFSNVDCVLIGDVFIKKEGEISVLSASTVYSNGDIPKGAHEPYLLVRYVQGRYDAGFRNARAETNTMGEKRNVKWLDGSAPTVSKQELAKKSQKSVQDLKNKNSKPVARMTSSNLRTVGSLGTIE